MGGRWESHSGLDMRIAVLSAQLLLEAPWDDGNRYGNQNCLLLFLLPFVVPSQNEELEMKCMGSVLEP